MEIQLLSGKREHVSQVVGKTMVLAGLATEVKPDLQSQIILKTTWRVFNQNSPYPPAIHWTCATCGFGGDSSAPDAARNPVRHGAGCCGYEEYPPADVVTTFEAANKRYMEAQKTTRQEKEKAKRVFFAPTR